MQKLISINPLKYISETVKNLGAWISPDGTTYYCDPLHHLQAAEEIVGLRGYHFRSVRDPMAILEGLGWIKMPGQSFESALDRSTACHITKAQKNKLFDFMFDNGFETIRYNGRTITIEGVFEL